MGELIRVLIMGGAGVLRREHEWVCSLWSKRDRERASQPASLPACLCLPAEGPVKHVVW